LVFSSITFLFYFLPLFLAAYFLAPTIYAKNLVTLGFSLVFYAWGEPRLVLLLMGSVVANMLAGLYVGRCEGRTRAFALAAAVAANLLLLIVYKYSNFIAENLDALLRPLGLSVPSPNIRFPLGISFFTFHSLSYLIDIYRRRFAPNRSLIEVGLYITLFPQLVAGPIVRYKTVARQLHARRSTLGRASAGARIFVIGLAQKVLIADQIAPLVEAVFDRAGPTAFADAWVGLVAYTLQIYFDFAGYSTMAVGIGLILGFTLPRNFRMPYASLSITEFWRRWHMSLSSWLRDYLYIPLGGNRGSSRQTLRNLVMVFLLCGMWHGASWNFLLWGMWHGALLVVERQGLGALLAKLPAAARWAYTLLAVMAGWVLFRAPDLARAGDLYVSMTGWRGFTGMTFYPLAQLTPVVTLALVAGALLAVLPQWLRLPKTDGFSRAVFDSAWTFGLVILCMTNVASGVYSPFLYFRF
jgi:D-alanyl-lipoteichoic acid acyltransferase DltB (MBOAT superfamily)